MKQSLLTNIKYLILGLAVAGALGLVHADFPLPTAAAPANNIDVPLHTGPDQVKNGGLSVNTFLANQNAQFKQQTFLNGTVFGGTPGLTSSTVAIGDTSKPANIVVKGNVSASQYIQSTSVANTSSSNLCANSNGTIVTCTVGASNTPSLTLNGSGPTPVNGQNVYSFKVGDSVQAGNKFGMVIFYHSVTVTAVAGDNAESITQKMIAAINNTTSAQWATIDSYAGYTGNPNDPNLYSGSNPSAQSSFRSATTFFVTIDSSHTIKTYGATPQ